MAAEKKKLTHPSYFLTFLIAQLVKNLPTKKKKKKESACNAGNPGSIPACIRKILRKRDMLPTPVFLGFPGGSAGKESACNQETWVLYLGWEDPLEKEMTTYSSILSWRISMNRGVWQAIVHGAAKSQT